MEKVRNLLFKKRTKKEQNTIIVIFYLIALIIFNIKIDNLQETVNTFPDETSHIAYIAYLEETGKIIPEFENMQELEKNINEGKNNFAENTVNHLGHPPIYYQLMRLFRVVQVNNGDVTYNLEVLRNISQLISSLAMILAFYIGFKKLDTVFSNIIYGFTLVFIPLMPFVSAGVQNDVISFFGVNIFIIGMLRFTEQKRNYLTYFIIATATLLCLLNKLTVGMIIICAYIIILIYTIIKEKSIKALWCKEFLVTMPIYLVILIYYLIILSKYGTVNPALPTIAPEYFKTTGFYNGDIYKPAYTFKVYARRYWVNFFTYWAGMEENSIFFNKNIIESMPSLLIFIFPIICFIVQKIRKKKINITYYAIYIGVILAIILQFIKARYEFVNVSGYLGGYHSRYYVCAMVAFAMLFCKLIEQIYQWIETRKDKKFLTVMFSLLILEYVFILL